MFASTVAIFRDKYLEIGLSKGEWNREIDQIKAMVRGEFSIKTARRMDEISLPRSQKRQGPEHHLLIEFPLPR
jgi:hypothetical protein